MLRLRRLQGVDDVPVANRVDGMQVARLATVAVLVTVAKEEEVNVVMRLDLMLLSSPKKRASGTSNSFLEGVRACTAPS